ncbi:hypothetical protein PANT111_190190 [Pantoea brenneri]|uniref:Uncharacterized protein n=1 Tax=Pantoea brenneri TaxID=472694 RepID=A0AAX3J6T8_9GAMM|nr:hypothetical protein PANT111_190190 [Pantoea brenneri]
MQIGFHQTVHLRQHRGDHHIVDQRRMIGDDQATAILLQQFCPFNPVVVDADPAAKAQKAAEAAGDRASGQLAATQGVALHQQQQIKADQRQQQAAEAEKGKTDRRHHQPPVIVDAAAARLRRL